MSVRNSRDGTIVFDCNGSGCNAELDTDMKEWQLALEVLRDMDWQIRRRGKEWLHFCEDCADEY